MGSTKKQLKKERKPIMKKVFFVFLFTLIALSMSFFAQAGESTVLEGVVNINTATLDELQVLPGIGEVRARQIVELRTKQPFAKKEDLLAVQGIGEKMFAKILPYLALEGKTTLKEVNGNLASTAVLTTK